jgi:hypothetical protein
MTLVLGLLLIIEQVPFLLRGIASRSWVGVPGRVIESRALRSPIPSGEGRGQWYPNGVRLAYEYTIEGERFVGGQSSWRGYWPSLSNAVVRARRYPVGAAVTVWVDPEDPRRCVLEPGFGFGNVLGTAIGLGLMALGLYTLTLYPGAV